VRWQLAAHKAALSSTEHCGSDLPETHCEIVQACVVGTDQPHDVAHRIGCSSRDSVDFLQVVSQQRSVVQVEHGQLADQRDAAQVAADIVVQVAGDLIAQRLNLPLAEPTLPQHGETHAGGRNDRQQTCRFRRGCHDGRFATFFPQPL
jgi:hypothetical protein